MKYEYNHVYYYCNHHYFSLSHGARIEQATLFVILLYYNRIKVRKNAIISIRNISLKNIEGRSSTKDDLLL